DSALFRLEKSHEDIEQATFSASRGSDQGEHRATGDCQAYVLECGTVSRCVGEVHLFERDVPPEFERRGQFAAWFLYRQGEQLDDLAKGRTLTFERRPPRVDLLYQREEALRSQGKCAERRERRGKTPRPVSSDKRDRRDHDHADHLDRIAGCK